MIEDPSRLVIRAKFARLDEVPLAPFRNRTTSFLVVAIQGFTGTATLGDNMARIAQLRGAVAVVTDGMVRDAADIVALGLPCFCRGVTPSSAFPSGPGDRSLWARSRSMPAIWSSAIATVS